MIRTALLQVRGCGGLDCRGADARSANERSDIRAACLRGGVVHPRRMTRILWRRLQGRGWKCFCRCGLVRGWRAEM